MTNQEQINEMMGKLLDFPQRPVFYEDDYPYPWKPFKSNGGTGDAPVDWLQPSMTAEPTPQPVAPKLCPFRKRISFVRDGKNGMSVGCEVADANFMEDEFLPCLREKCAVWNQKAERCGYGG